MINVDSSPYTLANFVGSLLTHSDNSGYAVRYRSYLLGTY